MTEYVYKPGDKLVLTERAFFETAWGQTVCGYHVPGLPSDKHEPGAIFSLSAEDLERVSIDNWLRCGAVKPYTAKPKLKAETKAETTEDADAVSRSSR